MKILLKIINFFDTCMHFILFRKCNRIHSLSVADLKRSLIFSRILERNSSIGHNFYSELSGILQNAYNDKSNEMSS